MGEVLIWWALCGAVLGIVAGRAFSYIDWADGGHRRPWTRGNLVIGAVLGAVFGPVSAAAVVVWWGFVAISAFHGRNHRVLRPVRRDDRN